MCMVLQPLLLGHLAAEVVRARPQFGGRRPVLQAGGVPLRLPPAKLVVRAGRGRQDRR